MCQLRHAHVNQSPAEIAQKQREISSPTPTRTLILCTDERTGSHHLAALLASTGVLGRAYEYFNTSWMKLHYPEYPENVLEQLTWAKRLSTTPNGVFSLKLHPWAMDRVSTSIDIGKDLPQPSFILLQRKDVLAQAISLSKAQQTGVYTSASWVRQRKQPLYQGEEILRIIQNLLIRRARWEAYFARNDIAPFCLDYTDLLSDPHRCVYEIARLVGIRERAVIGRVPWYHFDRQSDDINDSWRQQFLADFSGTGCLDVIQPEALLSHNGQKY